MDTEQDDKFVPGKEYSLAFKRMVVREALNGVPCKELAKKYNLPHYNTATVWKRYMKDEVSDLDLKPLTKQDKEDNKIISKRNNDLEKALSDANLKIVALETMIDIAERELNIKIRKKSGSKQSVQSKDNTDR
jgi:transposase-like protein